MNRTDEVVRMYFSITEWFNDVEYSRVRGNKIGKSLNLVILNTRTNSQCSQHYT